jgi:ribonuclease D
VQLTVAGRNFLVDPLARMDLQPFLAALAEKTLLFHDASGDLRMLQGAFGFRPRVRVIDTMIAAQLLGHERFGLLSLVEQFLGEKLTKSGQKSDWSRRPLSQAQLHYAVDDTRFLEPLADKLLADLSSAGRFSWFEEACAAATAATPEERVADPQRQWRIKGVWEATARQAAFVRQLWGWRDQEARRADLPPFKILGDEGLLALALWAESHPQALLATGPKLPRHVTGRRFELLGAALREAAQLGPSDWPEPRLWPVGKREEPGQSFGRLRESVARLAGELGLLPWLIAPRAALEEISRRKPTTLEEIQQAGRLLRWQAELLLPLVRRVLGAD